MSDIYNHHQLPKYSPYELWNNKVDSLKSVLQPGLRAELEKEFRGYARKHSRAIHLQDIKICADGCDRFKTGRLLHKQVMLSVHHS